MCGCIYVHMYAQWCPTICDPMDSSPPDTSVHGILQARMLEWIAIFYSKGGLPDSGIKPESLVSLALGDRFFTTAPPGKLYIYIYIYTHTHTHTYTHTQRYHIYRNTYIVKDLP